jgi:hypothetical protein
MHELCGFVWATNGRVVLPSLWNTTRLLLTLVPTFRFLRALASLSKTLTNPTPTSALVKVIVQVRKCVLSVREKGVWCRSLLGHHTQIVLAGSTQRHCVVANRFNSEPMPNQFARCL